MSLREEILACEWVPPPRPGQRRKPGSQPLVDLIERALDEWPLEKVDAVLDEYFGESPEGVLEYEWEWRQAIPVPRIRGVRGGLLPVQPNAGWTDEEREAG